MATYTAHRYDHRTDLAQIVAFVRAVRPTLLLNEYPAAQDLPELLGLAANQATARCWTDERGGLVGFAYLDAFHTLRFDLDWRLQERALEQAIIGWGERCLRGQHPWLYTTSHATDQQRLACLERHQFARRPNSIVHMTCALDRPIPTPAIPAGFAIRSIAGETEAAAVAAVHRAAFGTPHMTTERRLAMMRASSYDSALDLVAVAPDGTLAAYGLGQAGGPDDAPGTAYADLFATDPAFRSCGLAQALVQLIAQRLQASGYRVARLSTDSDNQAMQRVARSVGFRVTATTLRFARLVPPDVIGEQVAQ